MNKTKTIYDYIKAIETGMTTNLPDSALKQIRLDLIRFANIVRVDGNPRAIKATPRIIKSTLNKISPADAGMKPKRFKNFSSNIKRALREIHIEGSAYDFAKDLPSAWSDLLDSNAVNSLIDDQTIKVSKYALIRLNSFSKIACQFGFAEPHLVTADCFPDLCELAKENSFNKSSNVYVKDLCVAWNKFHRLCDCWPGEVISLPIKKIFKTQIHEMHPKLQNEIEIYIGYLRNPVKYSARYKNFRHRDYPLAEATIKMRLSWLCYATSCLLEKGRTIDELTAITDLVHPDSVQIVSDVYRERKQAELQDAFEAGNGYERGMEKSSGEHTILKTLRSICCDVAEPSSGIRSRLTALVNSADSVKYNIDGDVVQFMAAGKGLNAKNKTRLDQFKDEDVMIKFLELPRRLLSQVEAERKARNELHTSDKSISVITPQMAYRFQAAIALMLLRILPVRRSNLAAINLERHFRNVPTDSEFPARIECKSVKVKGVDLTFKLSPLALNYLKLYLKHYRTVITEGEPTDWMFPGENPCRHVDPTNLANRVSKLVTKKVGITFNIHLIRHLIAKIIIDSDPRSLSFVTDMLGHQKSETAREAYLENNIDAANKFKDQAIMEYTTYGKI